MSTPLLVLMTMLMTSSKTGLHSCRSPQRAFGTTSRPPRPSRPSPMVTRFEYSPDDYSRGFGFVRLIFAYSGTTWPMVLRSGLFWTVVTFHLLCHLAEHLLHYDFAALPSNTSESNQRMQFDMEAYQWTGLIATQPGQNGLPRLEWGVGTTASALCVFFLVFYTNSQCAWPGPWP